MKKTGMNSFIRLAGCILAAVFLFLTSGPNAYAQTSPQKYWVKIYPSVGTTICIGESTWLMASYHLNKGQVEKTAPIFTFEASNGEITSTNPAPGSPGAGEVYFQFKGTEAGVAKIWATANLSDGSDLMTIHVKKDCYSYQLIIELDATSTLNGVILKWQEFFLGKGYFTPTAADLAPLAPLTPNGTIKPVLNILDMNVPDQSECNAPETFWDNLIGSGTDIVSGQYLGKGNQADVRFEMTSIQITHTPKFTIPCKKGNISNFLSLSFTTGNGVNEVFPASGGTRQIKIDLMEKGVARLNSSPGTSASYTAYLTLKRAQ